MKIRTKAFYPEYLDQLESTELRFQMSPNNLLKNLIGARRAKQASKLGRVGYPEQRNDPVELVRTWLERFAQFLIFLSMCLRIDSRFQQPEHSLSIWHPTSDVYLPARLVTYPFMMEAFPPWLVIATMGFVIGHEFTHVFKVALHEGSRNWFNSSYLVRLCSESGDRHRCHIGSVNVALLPT